MPSVFIKMNLSLHGMKWRLFRFICDLRNNFLYFIGIEYCNKIWCFFFIIFFFQVQQCNTPPETYSLVADKCCIWCVRRLPFSYIQKIIKFSNEILNDIIQNRAHKENRFSVVQFYIKNIYFMKNSFAAECYLLWHIHKYWSFR